jgi:hypothetical protein
MCALRCGRVRPPIRITQTCRQSLVQRAFETYAAKKCAVHGGKDNLLGHARVGRFGVQFIRGPGSTLSMTQSGTVAMRSVIKPPLAKASTTIMA